MRRKIIINSLFLYNLFYKESLKQNPIYKVPTVLDDSGFRHLEIECLPQGAGNKAVIIVASIIEGNPNCLKESDHKWIGILARTSSMSNFTMLQEHITMIDTYETLK